MTIDRINIGNQPVGGNSQSDRTGETRNDTAKFREAGAGSSGSVEDSVALSPQARRIDQIASAVANERADRMAAIKDAIDNGTYDVPGDEVARKLIDANRR